MNYGNNLNCTWLIEVSSEFSSGGYILKVTFNDFQISVREYSICHDKLEFYDGNITLASLLGSYCGTVPPQVIYSTGQLLYIKFKSDGNFSSKGFSFNVSAVLEGKLQWNPVNTTPLGHKNAMVLTGWSH